jgi:hypothetical protein
MMMYNQGKIEVLNVLFKHTIFDIKFVYFEINEFQRAKIEINSQCVTLYQYAGYLDGMEQIISTVPIMSLFLNNFREKTEEMKILVDLSWINHVQHPSDSNWVKYVTLFVKSIQKEINSSISMLLGKIDELEVLLKM